MRQICERRKLFHHYTPSMSGLRRTLLRPRLHARGGKWYVYLHEHDSDYSDSANSLRRRRRLLLWWTSGRRGHRRTSCYSPYCLARSRESARLVHSATRTSGAGLETPECLFANLAGSICAGVCPIIAADRGCQRRWYCCSLTLSHSPFGGDPRSATAIASATRESASRIRGGLYELLYL